MERQLPGTDQLLHEHDQQPRRRRPSVGSALGVDKDSQQLRRLLGSRQEPQGEALGRGHPGGTGGHRLGQGPGSQVLQPDQGEAGLLGGARLGRVDGGRTALRFPRGESARCPAYRREGGRCGQGAGGGAEGARTHPGARARSTVPTSRASWPTAASAIQPSRNSSSSRATPPAARRNKAATGASRRCCRSRARS